jgi:transposase
MKNTKQMKFDQWGIGITPLMLRSDSMSIKPIEEINNASNKTYSQDWVAYNKAQTQEKILFLELLHELCNQIPQPKRIGVGRPQTSYKEMIFSCCLKTYLNFSSRRSSSDVKIAQQMGYLSHQPHFNTILKYLRKPVLSKILGKLIEASALPLKQVEEDFTMDASGFSTVMFKQWLEKRNKFSEYKKFKKAHVMSGVKTNVITHIEVTDGYVHDSKMLEILVKSTAEHFVMKEVSADKAYSSKKNLQIIACLGAIPFIPFKKNVRSNPDDSLVIWRVMYRFFKDHKKEFLEHYHKRSNAESVFSMIKRKFGDNVRAKDTVAQVNEVLCKALCHNICVLIQEMFELGIQIDFSEVATDEFMCKIEL